MSVIVGNFSLSVSSFVSTSMMISVVVTKYAKCPLCIIVRSDFFNCLEVRGSYDGRVKGSIYFLKRGIEMSR